MESKRAHSTTSLFARECLQGTFRRVLARNKSKNHQCAPSNNLTSKDFHAVPKLKTDCHPRIDVKQNDVLVVLRLARPRPISASTLLLALETWPKIKLGGGGASYRAAPAVRFRPLRRIGAMMMVVVGKVVERVRVEVRVSGRFSWIVKWLGGGSGGGAIGNRRCR